MTGINVINDQSLVLMTVQAPMTGLIGDGLLNGAIIRSPWTGMTARCMSHCRELVSQHCLY